MMMYRATSPMVPDADDEEEEFHDFGILCSNIAEENTNTDDLIYMVDVFQRKIDGELSTKIINNITLDEFLYKGWIFDSIRDYRTKETQPLW